MVKLAVPKEDAWAWWMSAAIPLFAPSNLSTATYRPQRASIDKNGVIFIFEPLLYDLRPRRGCEREQKGSNALNPTGNVKPTIWSRSGTLKNVANDWRTRLLFPRRYQLHKHGLTDSRRASSVFLGPIFETVTPSRRHSLQIPLLEARAVQDAEI